jgi:hypothetical protein
MTAFNQWQHVLFELAEQRRQNAISDRVGYVHEVNKDKVRVVMGIRPDGSPWLSPWLHTTNMRGGARERRLFAKGQNVRLSAPGGDFRQATLTHWAESKDYPAPDHADSYPNGETFQMGKLRVAKVAPSQSGGGGQQSGKLGASSDDHSYDIWIDNDAGTKPNHQDQSGKAQSGGGSQTTTSMPQSKAPDPVMKLRVNEKGYITGRVGTTARFAAHKDGVKIKHSGHTIFVDKDGCWTTTPIDIKQDPIPDDDN